MILFNKLITVDYTNISVNLKGKTNRWELKVTIT